MYPTNIQVDNRNEYILRYNKQPVVQILAENNPPIKDSQMDKDENVLPNEFQFSIGSIVMLRRNLWTAGGLVNGSVGQIINIVYHDDKHPPGLPSYVLYFT